MANSSLLAIQNKVRLLTRSPSAYDLSNDQINEYINTFLLYDMPSHLRLFNLKTTFNFICAPGVDTYATNTTVPTNQFYNFNNKYITVDQPAYASGYKLQFLQSRETFYNIWPFTNLIDNLPVVGDGATPDYTGTITNTPALPNNVLFNSVDSNGLALALIDVPVFDANGVQTQNGNLYVPGQEPATNPTVITPSNTINYATGVYSITFAGNPANQAPITSQTFSYSAGIPQTILYFNDTFTLRPVPDQAYNISVEVFIRPTELLNNNQSPELQQWWQYIAYGASKKVFEDRMDLDSVNQIMAEFKTQENLVNRTTLVQITKQRVATIFSVDNTGTSGNNWGNNWGGF